MFSTPSLSLILLYSLGYINEPGFAIIIVKLQSKVQSLGLGVDFVFPLSEQQEEQEEPPPKYTRMKHPRSLKFDT